MSRPRRPFGQNPPGRLPATMVKVLAAELSDQGRLARGKRYWAEHAVTDIVIGHGAVTAEIQGSRREPYIVTITAKPGTGVPGKRDVTSRCTCPDDGIFDACKHAVAALFALSDEIAIEPELLDRWRGGTSAPARAADDDERGRGRVAEDDDEGDDDEDNDDDEGDDGLADVVPIRPGVDRRHQPPERIARLPAVDPTIAEIGMLLGAPDGASPPEFPEVTPIPRAGLRQQPLGEVLDDALANLAINWE